MNTQPESSKQFKHTAAGVITVVKRFLSRQKPGIYYTVRVKKNPYGFLTFFPNGWEFFKSINTLIIRSSTLDYKFLFDYLQI